MTQSSTLDGLGAGFALADVITQMRFTYAFGGVLFTVILPHLYK